MAIGKSTTYKGNKYNLTGREQAIVDLAQESALTFDKAVTFSGNIQAGASATGAAAGGSAAGTLSGNPVAMSSGLAILNYLNEHDEVYTGLSEMTEYMADGIKTNLEELGLNYTINNVGSMISLFFTDQHVKDFETAKTCDFNLFG